MEERKAIYYGKIELIPGIVCDGYVLDDPEMIAVLSERGTADLLDMDQKTLNAVRGNWPIKTLEPFCDKDLIVRGNYVKVVAKNSPHCGREIVVYNSATIESLIRSYALAFINDGLRQNQIHIGKRAVALLTSLIRTALEAYEDAVKVVEEKMSPDSKRLKQIEPSVSFSKNLSQSISTGISQTISKQKSIGHGKTAQESHTQSFGESMGMTVSQSISEKLNRQFLRAQAKGLTETSALGKTFTMTYSKGLNIGRTTTDGFSKAL